MGTMTDYRLPITDYQLSTVNCQLRGRVYKIADLGHRWLVKPAPCILKE
jgi:hypothetical protein